MQRPGQDGCVCRAAPSGRRRFSPKSPACRLPRLGEFPGPDAYNPRMLETLQQLASTAFMERFTLWLNHVIASEAAAVQRLAPHAGRSIRLQAIGWPGLLPPLPELSFLVTPAGLLEWSPARPAGTPDLELTVDASNPARSVFEGLSGRRPAVGIVGDAALATDVSWLMDNLRWDLQDDLARFVGEGPAHELARLGGKLAGGLRDALGAVAGLAARGPTRR
jgi:ubiquinone biosynthesis protein UbiJ